MSQIVVARIAPEPINTITPVSEFRSRAASLESRVTAPLVAEEPILPPVPTPVPAPVPAPVIVSASEAFAAALIAQQLPVRPVTMTELRPKGNATWEAPASSLRLTDRRV